MRCNLKIACAIGALLVGFASAAVAQESIPAQPAATDGESSPSTESMAEPGNTLCPVTVDKEVDPNFFVIHEGRKIYFCCRMCRTKFEWDPEKYLANLPPLATPVSLLQQSDDGQPQHEDDGHSHDDAPAAGTESDSETLESIYGDEEEHDHADHAGDDPGLTQILSYLGRFHVVVIHFPIALLVFGGLFEFASMLGAGSRAFGVIRASVALGALSAVVAMSLGLMNAIGLDYSGTLADVFWWHRLLGITTATLAVVAWIAVERRARKPSGKAQLVARIAVFVAAAFVGITGHLGGSLVFGWNYFMP